MASGVASMAGCSLMLEGVSGPSSDGSVPLHSFSWGVSNPTSIGSSGLSAGKVSLSDLSIMKRVDRTSPALFTRATMGTRSKSAVLSCRDGSGEYYRVTLQDVVISSYVSQSGEAMPMESLSLNFTKIEFSYAPQKADGTLDVAVKATYDLKAAKK